MISYTAQPSMCRGTPFSRTHDIIIIIYYTIIYAFLTSCYIIIIYTLVFNIMFAGSGRRRRTLRLAGCPAAPTDCRSIYNIIILPCTRRAFFGDFSTWFMGPVRFFFSDFLRKHRVRPSIIRYRTINSPGLPRPFASEAMHDAYCEFSRLRRPSAAAPQSYYYYWIFIIIIY